MDPNREFFEEDIIEFRRCFKNNEQSIEKYRLYGPSNPFKSIDGYFPQCEFSDDGICYMMQCRCKEEDNDDWYTGECLTCELELPKRVNAWRRPCINGSFIGCFCRNHFRPLIVKGEYVDEDETYPLINLCDIMEVVRDKFPILYEGEGLVFKSDQSGENNENCNSWENDFI